MMSPETRLEARTLCPDAELRQFIDGLDGDGAVVSFVGIARPRNKDGASLTALYLDHYPGMTERSLRTIAEEAVARFSVTHVRVVHRCGGVGPGEPIVFVATASPHRRAAFLAADYLMDRLKTDAAFWKREDTAAGSRWIEPTSADHEDRKRWSETCGGN